MLFRIASLSALLASAAACASPQKAVAPPPRPALTRTMVIEVVDTRPDAAPRTSRVPLVTVEDGGPSALTLKSPHEHLEVEASTERSARLPSSA